MIKKVLVIHGPNMNLLGLKKLGEDGRLTLDKLNRDLRKVANSKKITLSIKQTHDENKIVSYLHRNRTKFNHIILSPEIWNIDGYLLKDTLSLIKIPLSIIKTDKDESSIFDSIVKSSNIQIDKNYVSGYSKILQSLS